MGTDSQAEVKTTAPDTEGKVKATGKTSKTPQPQQLIYVGPNLPGGRLSRFRVFREGIPPYLDDIIQDNPDLERLIVPLDIFPDVVKRVETPGTIEHAAATKLMEGKRDE